MGVPSKAEILEYWKEWLILNCFDLGEPSCWACGKWWDDKYDIKNTNITWNDIKKAWNKVPLQRCHIIPRSLGGTEDASNLFLMCRECHDLAPNTTSREQFFKWVEKQNWAVRVGKIITDELNTYDVKDDEYENLINILNSQEFKRWMRDNIGLHFNQEGKGAKLTVSSFIALIVEYKKSQK